MTVAASTNSTQPLLQVEELRTFFHTSAGVARAVDGVSFSIARGETVSVVGDAYPLYCTANGKAYLGQIEDDAIIALIGRKYPRRTRTTKTTFADLVADLRAVRQTGVAVDLEEHSSGVCATGVALRDPAGNYVAISVPVPSQRFKDEYKMIARRLLEGGN